MPSWLSSFVVNFSGAILKFWQSMCNAVSSNAEILPNFDCDLRYLLCLRSNSARCTQCWAKLHGNWKVSWTILSSNAIAREQNTHRCRSIVDTFQFYICSGSVTSGVGWCVLVIWAVQFIYLVLTLASSSCPTLRKAIYCLTPSIRFWNSTLATFILDIIEPILPANLSTTLESNAFRAKRTKTKWFKIIALRMAKIDDGTNRLVRVFVLRPERSLN